MRNIVAILCFSCSSILAHSWIDNISQLDNLTNIGYIRGYAGHSDAASTFLIETSGASQAICKPNQQTLAYTAQYPMLSIQAGKSFVANYSENGHVTKDSLPPDNRPHPGNYTWYLVANSATMPSPLSTLGTASISGQVVDTGPFDDGKCAEDATRGRDGPRQCQSTVQIPSSTSPGLYQMIWLWNFPKVVGVVEMYSSCMDVQVLTGDGDHSNSQSAIGNVHAVNVQEPTDSSSIQTTRTLTVFQTTSLYTTVPAPVVESSVNAGAQSANTMVNRSMPPSSTTFNTPTPTFLAMKSQLTKAPVASSATVYSPRTYTTVVPKVQQQQANPLFNANNVVYNTRFVTVTMTA